MFTDETEESLKFHFTEQEKILLINNSLKVTELIKNTQPGFNIGSLASGSNS